MAQFSTVEGEALTTQGDLSPQPQLLSLANGQGRRSEPGGPPREAPPWFCLKNSFWWDSKLPLGMEQSYFQTLMVACK